MKLLKERDVLPMIVAIRDKAGGVRALAKELGVSPSYISDLCNGRRAPSKAILAILGLRKVTGYLPSIPESEAPHAP